MNENSKEFSMEDNVDGGSPSVSGYELPTGYLDEAGKIHREIMFQEMTGEEEDILAARKMDINLKISKILENCIVSIGDFSQKDKDWPKIIKSLVESDRMFCLLKIRIISLGADLNFKSTCPNEECKKTSSLSVSLEEIKITGLKNPMERNWSGALPRTKKPFTCSVLSANKRVETDTDILSSLILSRLVSLDNKEVTMSMVKKLPLLDRNYLRGQIKEWEGEVDSEIEITCPFCKTEYKTDLDIGTPDFFFPSAI